MNSKLELIQKGHLFDTCSSEEHPDLVLKHFAFEETSSQAIRNNSNPAFMNERKLRKVEHNINDFTTSLIDGDGLPCNKTTLHHHGIEKFVSELQSIPHDRRDWYIKKLTNLKLIKLQPQTRVGESLSQQLAHSNLLNLR